MKQYKAYIFDMDGTVLNTLDDLRNSVNYAMEQTGHRHDFDSRVTGLLFGSAVKVGLTRALALEAGYTEKEIRVIGTPQDTLSEHIDEKEVERILAVYRPHYRVHCNDLTRPYDGIMAMLGTLQEKGCKTAVVSNKPDEAVQKLNREHFGGIFDFAIGESPRYARKPAPDMVLEALEVLGVTPEESVYIGDTEIDLQTAANCGMDCIAVSWGFRTPEYLQSLGAEIIVDDPAEIAGELSGEEASVMSLARARELMQIEGNASDLGAELDVLRKGYAEGHLTIEQRHKNPAGVVCGGALYSLVDIVSIFAAASYGGGGSTVQGSICYLRPAVGNEVRCRTNVTKAGKTLIYTHSLLTIGETEIATADLLYVRTDNIGPGNLLNDSSDFRSV